MEWIPVISSNLSSVRYDDENLTLEIEFNDGRIYQFFDVPNQIFEGLLNAESHGKFFHLQIKGKYRYVRL